MIVRLLVAVLDINVLAAGFMRSETLPGRLLTAWMEGRFELVVSQHILDGLERTFAQPYFRRRLSTQQAAENVAFIREFARYVEITVPVRGIATHAEDDVVLATALSAGADYLVTGDFPFRRVGSYQGVTIISPRRFLDILEAQGAPQ